MKLCQLNSNTDLIAWKICHCRMELWCCPDEPDWDAEVEASCVAAESRHFQPLEGPSRGHQGQALVTGIHPPLQASRPSALATGPRVPIQQDYLTPGGRGRASDPGSASTSYCDLERPSPDYDRSGCPEPSRAPYTGPGHPYGNGPSFQRGAPGYRMPMVDVGMVFQRNGAGTSARHAGVNHGFAAGRQLGPVGGTTPNTARPGPHGVLSNPSRGALQGSNPPGSSGRFPHQRGSSLAYSAPEPAGAFPCPQLGIQPSADGYGRLCNS